MPPDQVRGRRIKSGMTTWEGKVEQSVNAGHVRAIPPISALERGGEIPTSLEIPLIKRGEMYHIDLTGQHPPVTVRVCDDGCAVAPGLIFRVRHADTRLAGLGRRSIHVAHVGVESGRPTAGRGRIPTANQHDYRLAMAHFCISHLAVRVREDDSPREPEGPFEEVD